ncbi:hypothetical protein IFM89_003804 [Coptis chinensis]|uniref:Uncharacterized protein n=1 Tax=Coptis chinensis TaxID=261450 RepID=A0A835L9X6_9MAGN|nr:hypothetical protein IFM89_003804 [Coptis chinensis]
MLLLPAGADLHEGQAHRICFEFDKCGADQTYIRIDGGPWKQPLPVDDDIVVIEMLTTHDWISKSIDDPTSYSSNHNEDGSRGEDFEEDSEERRKFGAADTFKLPGEVDISRLSYASEGEEKFSLLISTNLLEIRKSGNQRT